MEFLQEEAELNESLYTETYKDAESQLLNAFSPVRMPEKVLIVDDWSETGAQMRGAISLAEKCGAKVIGVAAVNIDDKVLQDKTLSKYILHYIEHYR